MRGWGHGIDGQRDRLTEEDRETKKGQKEAETEIFSKCHSDLPRAVPFLRTQWGIWGPQERAGVTHEATMTPKRKTARHTEMLAPNRTGFRGYPLSSSDRRARRGCRSTGAGAGDSPDPQATTLPWPRAHPRRLLTRRAWTPPTFRCGWALPLLRLTLHSSVPQVWCPWHHSRRSGGCREPQANRPALQPSSLHITGAAASPELSACHWTGGGGGGIWVVCPRTGQWGAKC